MSFIQLALHQEIDTGSLFTVPSIGEVNLPSSSLLLHMHYHSVQGRLTHSQLLLVWKPAPLQSSITVTGLLAPLRHSIE